MATKKELVAWAAGIFEGEGCIYFRGSSTIAEKRYVRISVRMDDNDVVEKFYKVVGERGNFYSQIRKANEKQFWVVEMGHQKDVAEVLTMFLPFFGKRRAKKAREALDKLSKINPRHQGGLKMGESCSRGHKITANNHYIKRSRGVEYVMCKRCLPKE